MNDSVASRSHNTHGSVLIYGRPQGICKRWQNSKPVYFENRELLDQEVSASAVVAADEFIHKFEQRRTHVSKFIYIYIHFRYAGVTTGCSSPNSLSQLSFIDHFADMPFEMCSILHPLSRGVKSQMAGGLE